MAQHETSDKPIRVGVVGLGMGRNHIIDFNKHPRAKVVALCDLDKQKLEQFASQHGIEKTYTDTQHMFESGDIDVVSIATPNFLHHPQAMAALASDLHVLCEKPLALRPELAEEMVSEARNRGRKLAVNFSHRAGTEIQTMYHYAQDGDLGDVHFVRTLWHRRRGIPGIAKGGWFFQHEKSGGGCLIDLGVHILDYALYVMGRPKVVAVTGDVRRQFGQVDAPGMNMDVEDFAVAQIRVDTGAVISLEVSWACHHDRVEQMGLSVYGSKAGIFMNKNWPDPTTLNFSRREHNSLLSGKLERCQDHCPTVAEDLIDAILEDRDPECRGEDGLTASRVIDAIYRSSESGQEIRLD